MEYLELFYISILENYWKYDKYIYIYAYMWAFFKIRRDFCLGNLGMITKSVDGCEILHQLIDGQNPIIYRLLTIQLMVQDFATIHSMVGGTELNPR